jgi:hypothetical protein
VINIGVHGLQQLRLWSDSDRQRQEQCCWELAWADS